MASDARRCIKKISGKLRGRVETDQSIVSLYIREPSGLEGEAYAVVFPESEGDVSVVLRECYRHETPVYPQGSATSLSGNAVPGGGVVLSMERMRRIREVSVVDSLAVVEPGVRIDDLNMALQGEGYMFPVDPASSAVATVGGAINNGAGGLRGAKYGTMRDWVLGLRLGLADGDGTIIE
ncbi:MAG: FAD-binding oxidoreductase, partial [Desulfurococcales archaeon]|nr:FAD-binding oxidoreductase [Desulfurococcales archaeon]